MRYLVKKRMRAVGFCGEVNLRYGTVLDAADGVAFLPDGRAVCAVTSQNAHDYLARHDDGGGPERGRLVDAITGRLARRDRAHQTRWDRVWADAVCQRYRRKDYDDYWLWDHTFYEAALDDLRHIAELIGVRTP